jgi:signal transduction histidine kinase
VKKTRIRDITWLYLVIFLALEFMVFFALDDTQVRRQTVFDRRKVEIVSAYSAVTGTYGNVFTTIFEEIINRPEITSIMDKALTGYLAGNQTETDKARSAMLRLLAPTYARLTRHNLRQLHFHLPNNRSFLRMHKPDRYGDDLTKFRLTVATVNATLKPVQGFEEGRVLNGFRVVFPLFHNGRHVGSVEASASFTAIRHEMHRLFPGTYLFAVLKSHVEDIVFNDMLDNYVTSDISPILMYDWGTSDVSMEDSGSNPGMYTIGMINRIQSSRVSERINRKEFFVDHVRVSEKDFLVTYFPIHDFRGDPAAYIISYVESRDLQGLRRDYLKYLILANAGILLFVAFLHSAVNQSRMVQEHRDRLMTIAGNIQDGLILTDNTGMILYENPAVPTILGMSLMNLNQPLHECIALFVEGRELSFQEWSKLTLNRFEAFDVTPESTVDIKVRMLLSSSVPVEAVWSPIGESGREDGHLLVFRDVTGLRRYHLEINEARQTAEAASRQLSMANQRLEKALESARRLAMESQMASHAKSNFLANMSHELRTPMNAVIGISSMIMNHCAENLNEKQIEGLELINRNGQRLLTLINDLLDMAKIEAGKMSFKLSPFHLRGLITEVAGIVDGLIMDNDIEFEWFVDPSLPEVVESDQKRIHQILVNLLGNSAKFTENGRIFLKVYPEDGKLFFLVRDTGIGISNDKVNTVFEEFSQVSMDDSRMFGGTGLGLTISRRLVEGLGGEVTIQSILGSGTTVIFWIPLHPCESADAMS